MIAYSNRKPDAMSEYRRICSISDVPDGSARAFLIDKLVVGIYHVGGRFYALEDPCPHAGASLARGTIEEDALVVRCRIHHWGFCLHSGRYVDEDNPQYDASTLAVRVVDDEVQVRTR